LAFIPVLLSGGNRGAPQLGQPGQVPHELSTQAMAYEYDQLNRLTQAAAFDQFADNAWQATNSIPNKYRNEFSYDANGNIATQSRYNGQGNLIDSLVYFYESENGKKTNNRLYHYHDLSSDTTALELEQTNIPFDSAAPNSVLSSNFFRYDELGNLVADLSNDIHRIDWRADGKVRSVHKTDSSHLSFDYDGLGNRIAKHQHRYDTLIKSTYYSRDAQGNVMAIYEKTLDHNNSTLSHQIKERYIYGSNRVGTFIEEAEMIGSSTTNTTFSHHLGARNYELVNHLGNVLAVVSDAPIKVDTNNDHLRDYNLPTLLSSQDYYPFGSLMRERSFGGYRYGFNGMEKDDEVKGSGNSYTTEFRQCDPRLGRWLSIDPLFRSFPWQSPYVAFDNNPIRKVDPRGDAAGDPEGKKRVEESKSRDGTQTYDQIRPLNLEDDKTDCSEHVYSVMCKTDPEIAKGFLVDGNVNTNTIRKYIESHGGFRKTNPKDGDLIMWEGHIEIITDVDGDKFLIHGARGSKGSEVPTSLGQTIKGYVWLSTSYSKIDQIGAGKYIGFWTPKTKANKIEGPIYGPVLLNIVKIEDVRPNHRYIENRTIDTSPEEL
jgi:RHS repeat-associated protein